MFKLIELLKRDQSVDVEEFQTRMLGYGREQIGQDDCVQYVQSHSLLQGYRKGELLVDVVGEYWFESGNAALSAARQRHGFAAYPPGLLDLQASSQLVVQPYIIKGRSVPSPAVKNIEFVHRREGMNDEDFFHYWRHQHGPLAATISSVLRYEQNHLASRFSAQVSRYDGLAITWFESTSAMRSGAETQAYQLTREDERNFLPDGHLPIVITKEVIRTGPL